MQSDFNRKIIKLTNARVKKHETIVSTSLNEVNDISNPQQNPVISKIEAFMSQKDRRNSVQGKAMEGRLSFLSIRNLWTNPRAANLLERN